MRVASRLGKFLWELEEECDPEELALWIAHFYLEAKEEEEARKKANWKNSLGQPKNAGAKGHGGKYRGHRAKSNR